MRVVSGVRQAWDKITGAPILVDDQTFNPEWHSDIPVIVEPVDPVDPVVVEPVETPVIV